MTAIEPSEIKDDSINGEADIVERAIRNNTQRYLSLLNISQNDLTGPLGITKGAVSQLLTGNSKLKFRQVYILARTFGVTIEDLMDPTYMLKSEELSRQLMENRRNPVAVLPRFFVMPETNQLALRAPNSQNGRLALGAPEC